MGPPFFSSNKRPYQQYSGDSSGFSVGTKWRAFTTDRLIDKYFCRQFNEQISDSVLILLSMAIACSEHYLEFRGSLSLCRETFLVQATDKLMSAHRHGFKNLEIFKSHGGNQGVGTVILEKLDTGTGFAN